MNSRQQKDEPALVLKEQLKEAKGLGINPPKRSFRFRNFRLTRESPVQISNLIVWHTEVISGRVISGQDGDEKQWGLHLA